MKNVALKRAIKEPRLCLRVEMKTVVVKQNSCCRGTDNKIISRPLIVDKSFRECYHACKEDKVVYRVIDHAGPKMQLEFI